MKLPQAFIERTQPILGEEFELFCEALESETPISIRINAKKTSSVFDFQTVLWSNSGYYLPSRPAFTLDPFFHAGVYYVQEASSMFLEQVIKQYVTEPVRMLDLCAAPGGKSTHLASLLPEGSLLVSNEYVRSRAYILAENLQKWGNTNSLVCNSTPNELGELSSFFDAILVDAPCSGEGMFRKDEGAIDEWSVQNVQTCVARQRDILEAIWSSLKTDGLLIYSTCTYNREENEEQVQWMIEELGAELLPINIDVSWGITQTAYGNRFYPHKTKGEGFFMAALRKSSEERQMRVKPEKQANKFSKEQMALQSYVEAPDDFDFAELGEKMVLLPKAHAEAMRLLIKKFKVLHAGIPLGVMKGKSFLPDAGLAFSQALNKEACVQAELDLLTALKFLRTENIVLDNVPQGLVLLTFKGIPLGWVKNLGNRCNSLYPDEWRIRMNLPTDLPTPSVIV